MGFIFKILGSHYHHARRYNKIIRILGRYGFEDYVAHLEKGGRWSFLRKLIPKKRYLHAIHLSRWEKIRLACEELGPTFIKFGQVLSNRADLLPKELISELEKLQDKVPPFPEKQVRKSILEQLGKEPEELFKTFEDTPLASASIAQVHKATLENGQDVVLKIQRPGIREMIKEDISIMYDVVDIFINQYPEIRAIDPIGLIHQFEESILHELDFINESVNIQRFAFNFKDDPDIYIPQVYKRFTTSSILTLEFINGIKVSDHAKLEESGLTKEIIAKRIINSYYKQVFDHGFFHADPHAGNIFALPDNKICFVDFGMMGNVLKKDIDVLASLFSAVNDKNTKKITKALELLADSPFIEDHKKFEYDIFEFVNTFAVTKVHNQEMSTMVSSLRSIVINHKLQVPAHFFLLSKSLISIEGVVRKLDPKMKLLTEAYPYMAGVAKRKLNPLNFVKRIANSAVEFGLYLEDLPGDIKEVVRKIKKGEVKVELEHKGIDPVIHTLNRISKQLVSAIIIGALILGSSLIILADIPPHWHGIPVLGIIGIIISVIVAIGMVNNLSKEDKGY